METVRSYLGLLSDEMSQLNALIKAGEGRLERLEAETMHVRESLGAGRARVECLSEVRFLTKPRFRFLELGANDAEKQFS